MGGSEKITGGAISKIFEELLLYKTLLRLTIENTDFENLTLVSGLTTRNKKPHFTIDPPEGFSESAADIDPWCIHFQFTGKDHIKYRFTTIGGEIDDDQIYVKMPQEMKRMQRRELFRLKAPVGTKLCITQHAARHELGVINISIGGSLAALVQTDYHVIENPPFADTQNLTDVKLIFPSGIMRQPIKIKTARIKRMKKNPETTQYEVALEFFKISASEKKRLTDLIYRLQRQYLRHRLPLDI